MKLVNQRGLGQRLSILLHKKLVAQRILYASPPALVRARISATYCYFRRQEPSLCPAEESGPHVGA